MKSSDCSLGVVTRTAVIAGHSRPKDGVASLAYDPAIHPLRKVLPKKNEPPGQAGVTI
jgi:hypothetical protein